MIIIVVVKASTGDDTKINLLNVEKATSAIQLEGESLLFLLTIIVTLLLFIVGTKDRVTCTAWSSDGVKFFDFEKNSFFFEKINKN